MVNFPHETHRVFNTVDKETVLAAMARPSILPTLTEARALADRHMAESGKIAADALVLMTNGTVNALRFTKRGTHVSIWNFGQCTPAGYHAPVAA